LTENNIQEELIVNNQRIRVVIINGIEYISLTDLARYADPDEPKIPIQNWMRNKDVVLYLGLWEKIHNKSFKGVEFDTFKNNSGSNMFRISPQTWIKNTDAIGMISKSGRYDSGTYAVSDIAFELSNGKIITGRQTELLSPVRSGNYYVK